MLRVIQKLTVLVTVSATLLFISGPRTAGAASPGEIRVALSKCVCVTAMMLAVKQGWLQEELGSDVKLTVQEYKTGVAQMSAILAGALDIGGMGSTPAIALIARNAPIQIFFVMDDEDTVEGLVVKSDAGISKVSDLKGKRVGVQVGTTSDYALGGAILNAGLQPSDVTIVNIPQDALIGAWSRGDIQGAYAVDPHFSRLANEGGTKLQTIGQLRAASKGEYSIVDVWLTRTEFADKYPEAVRAVARALERSHKLIEEDAQEVARLVHKDFGIDSVEEALRQIRGTRFVRASEQSTEAWLGTPGNVGALAQSLTGNWEFLHRTGKVQTEPSRDQVEKHIAPQYLAP